MSLIVVYVRKRNKQYLRKVSKDQWTNKAMLLQCLGLKIQFHMSDRKGYTRIVISGFFVQLFCVVFDIKLSYKKNDI